MSAIWHNPCCFSREWAGSARSKRIVTMDQHRPRTREMSRLLRAFALLTVLFAAPAMAQAPNFENLDRLDQLVAITTGANIGEPGGPVTPIDRRLRLKPCGQTPKVEGPVFGAAILSCADAGWRIRVPLVAVAAAPAERAPMIGATTRIAVGQPVVSAEKVVKKGDPVELIAGSEVFSVSRIMIADEDGAVGDMIRVRQDAKSTPVSARVERAGRVRAPTI